MSNGLTRRLRRWAAGGTPGLAGGSDGAHRTMGDVVRRVRDCDLSGRSDSELKETLERRRGLNRIEPGDDAAVEAFAAVDEAISRRLGAWRIFGDESGTGLMARHQALASRLASMHPKQTAYADGIDEDTLLPYLAARASEMGLGEDEGTVAATIAYVRLTSRVAYAADILLPAEFYRSLSALDAEGVTTFRATDEQLLAGLHMSGGHVVEMDAGEGKTISAAFTAVWHALNGRPVHVVTANDYLAGRDANWLAPVYESLGLTVGAVLGYMDDDERRHGYGQQIVYGTIREFAFDYLRDNLKHPPSTPVQGPMGAAIVDEADHVLIDQALTPMIIAGDSVGGVRAFERVRDAVGELVSLQSAVVRELVRQLDEAAGDRAGRVELAARLYLADPRETRLASLFASDRRARHRARRRIDSNAADDTDHALERGLYYSVDPDRRWVTLTEEGQGFLEDKLGPMFDGLEADDGTPASLRDEGLPVEQLRQRRERRARRSHRRYARLNQVHQMLRAQVLLDRDVDYTVIDGEVVLIDELTGRTLAENRYQDGLHAALEAKEGVDVRPECEVLAQISVPGMLTRYPQVCGMTGTAVDSREELERNYGLRVVRVEPHLGSRRVDHGPRVYLTRADKLAAVVDEVRRCRSVGRPVLVGTLTVEQSEEISGLLTAEGISHNLLNAVRDDGEAEVVRQAGAFGAVTIATNMAGRGTDIVLDDDLDERVAAGYRRRVMGLLTDGRRVELACGSAEEARIIEGAFDVRRDGTCTVQRTGATLRVWRGDEDEPGESISLEAGLGLYVVGTELNRSVRVDRQLWGRSGRQGAHGASRPILSMEDRAIAHGGNISGAVTETPSVDATGRDFYEGRALESSLRLLQDRTADDDEASRLSSRQYDRVLESQTEAYYKARREVMEAGPLKRARCLLVEGWAERLVGRHFPALSFQDYESQFRALASELSLDYGMDVLDLEGERLDALSSRVAARLAHVLETSRSEVGTGAFSYLERLLFLQTSDELWREHMVNLRGLMSSVTASPHGSSPVAEYAVAGSAEFERLKLRVVDAFLQRLSTFPAEASVETSEERVALSEEASLILA